MLTHGALLISLALAAGDDSAADKNQPPSIPRPVPVTRPEMKQLLEDMKVRRLRFPLPELTAEDREKLGDRADNYEARLRYHYLPPGEGQFGGFGRPAGTGQAGSDRQRDWRRNADESMSLDYPFKTMLFWIVSRTNNCQYCLGHQEQKLSAVGMTDDEIAALDFAWERYTPAQQAAFAYARKLTYEPHLLSDADIEALRKHYTDLQILEMTTSVAGNNSTNRWKEGSGVPQSQTGASFFSRASVEIPQDRPVPDESFLTPTAAEFQNSVSKVAVLDRDEATGAPTRRTVSRRPKLESRGEVEQALDAARQRTPRLPLVSEGEARAALGEDWPAGPLPQWVRLLVNFPNEARSRIRNLRSAEDKGDLSPLLKAQVSWIIARQDRAWYATGLAQQRLRALGQSDEQIFALDGGWEGFTPAERALFTVARSLAATPIVLTDDEVAEALRLTGPREVVQLITFVTGRAYLDRVTEAAGLPLEPEEVAAAPGNQTDAVAATPPSDQPKIVPITRDEVKQALDDLKHRKPRFPRRERPDGERNRDTAGGTRERGGEGRGEGGRRRGGGGGGLSRGDDPVMSLDYAFSVELFWIVSRINNCHYCLGHQENKLLAAGLSDDRIAALDGDWEQFTPAEQAAFAFTRKLTIEPHLVSDADFARLREHFTELQTLEIVHYVSRYNSMNRRTDGMGLAQQANRVFKTPTSDRYKTLVTTVALVDASRPAGALAPAAVPARPPLEPRSEALARLAECRQRTARFPLVDDAAARELVPEWPAGALPQYVRLLANFPRTGVGAAEGQRRSEEQGDVAPLMRAQIAWISARHDRAWYALGRALARLRVLGQTQDQVFALDNLDADSGFSSAELAAFRLTRKFAVSPQWITDADVEAVRRSYGDQAGAEIVSRCTQAAYFDRLTEASGLKLED